MKAIFIRKDNIPIAKLEYCDIDLANFLIAFIEECHPEYEIGEEIEE